MTRVDQSTLHALFTQPGVRQFLFDDEIIPPEKTAEIIETSRGLFEERGYGLWLARHGAAAVGFGGFWHFRDPPERELLYGVADDRAGQGYGREIARAIVQYGVAALQMHEVRASTDAAHAASRRLLEEIGFRFERQAMVGALDTVFYVLRPVR